MEKKSKDTRVESSLIREQFPANNRPSGEPKQKKVEKVITGSVRTHKKSFWKRTKEALVEGDGQSISQYVIYDVLIPSVKMAVVDMGIGALEMLFGCEGTFRGRGRDYRDRERRNYVSYDRRYDDRGREPRGRERRDYDQRSLGRELDDVGFDSRAEAEIVLSNLCDIIDEFGEATVKDFYELVGIEAEWTDEKYGWTTLRSAYAKRVRGEWVIVFPRTEVLEY